MTAGVLLLLGLATGLCDDAPRDLSSAVVITEVAQEAPASARQLIQEHAARGELDQARALYTFVRTAACADAPSVERARDDVAALLAAEQITAVRQGEDVFDYIMRNLERWLEALVSLDGVQESATAFRVVFLGLLSLFLVFLVWRLIKNRATQRALQQQQAAVRGVERERVARFFEWRARADALVDSGEVLAAMRAGQMALLSRLMEVERTAVSDARTGREILAELDDDKRGLARGPLMTFERAYFSGRADGAACAHFLSEVDSAAAALEAAS